MFPPMTRLVLGALAAVAIVVSQLVAYVAGLAGWYRDCAPFAKMTKRKGYLLVFLPLLVAIAGLQLSFLGLIPDEWMDEVAAIGAIVGALVLVLTAANTLFGRTGNTRWSGCKTTCAATVPSMSKPMGKTVDNSWIGTPTEPVNPVATRVDAMVETMKL